LLTRLCHSTIKFTATVILGPMQALGQRAPFQLGLCVARDDRNGTLLIEVDEVE